jgi:hypothetical protein
MIAPVHHAGHDAFPDITDVSFQAARPELVETGLLGWIEFCVAGLHVEGITLRRTADGRNALSYPVRRLVRNRKSFYLRPLDDRARQHIERQVFGALRLDAEVRT